MKNQILKYVLGFIVFGVCLFFGMWLMDIIFNDEPEPLKPYLLKLGLSSLITTILFFYFIRRSTKKNKNS